MSGSGKLKLVIGSTPRRCDRYAIDVVSDLIRELVAVVGQVLKPVANGDELLEQVVASR